jgi:putative spermidine/putrescine transport system permease protein
VAGSQRKRWTGTYLPLVPFFFYVSLFLLLPTFFVLVGAFQSADGSLSLENIRTVVSGPRFLQAFGRSVQLSLVSALAGAILGGLLAWAVSVGGPGGRLRQIAVAASGVLAQFGGVMLAFAFLATFGINGLVTVLLQDSMGVDLAADSTWIYGMNGLTIVYTYFQIPLMVIVFLPALDGLRQEWWEASTSLGGSSWSYWRHVNGPILAPSFWAPSSPVRDAFSACDRGLAHQRAARSSRSRSRRRSPARSSSARRTSARRSPWA